MRVKNSKYAGLELLERLKKLSPGTPVIVNSAWDEVETAKACIDKGASDYFVKGRTDEMLQKISGRVRNWVVLKSLISLISLVE